MFTKTIHIRKANDIRYGTTTMSWQKTYSDIMGLLLKHKCDQVYCKTEKGLPETIGFMINNKPYVIAVPKVYVNQVFNDKIGVRLVYYFLTVMLELVKDRIIDIEFLMLSSRMVIDENGEMRPLSERLMPMIEQASNQKPLLTQGEANQQ